MRTCQGAARVRSTGLTVEQPLHRAGADCGDAEELQTHAVRVGMVLSEGQLDAGGDERRGTWISGLIQGRRSTR